MNPFLGIKPLGPEIDHLSARRSIKINDSSKKNKDYFSKKLLIILIILK